jgi:hypothetical protein
LGRMLELSGTVSAIMFTAVRNAAPEPTAAMIAPTRNRSRTYTWLDASTRAVRPMYASNELSSPANAPDPNTNIAQASL